MKEKIKESKKILAMINREYRSPIIYSGLGKDSICVIHLTRSMGFNWPIMFHRDPYFPKKYRYANKLIEKWNLICFDYPAHGTSVFYHNNTFEVVRHFQVGITDMILCAMLYEPDEYVDGEYLCAFRDIYSQPLGTRDYPWDVGIQGHRRHESKPHSGHKPNRLQWVCKQGMGGIDWYQPLREWTNHDVYRYIVDNGIPINTDVYEVQNGELVPKIDPATGKIDSTYNPDRRPACFDCMKPENPPSVYCRKRGCLVNNVWPDLNKTIMPTDYPNYHEEQGE